MFLENHGAGWIPLPFEKPQGAIVFGYIPATCILGIIGAWSLWALLGTLVVGGAGLFWSIYLLYPKHLLWYKKYNEEWVCRYGMILRAISPEVYDSFQEDGEIPKDSFCAMNILANLKPRLSAELLGDYDDSTKIRLLKSFQDEIGRTYFRLPILFIGYDEIVKVIDPFTSRNVFLKPEDYVGGDTSLVDAILKCQDYMLEKNNETISQIRKTFSKHKEDDVDQIGVIKSYFSEREAARKRHVKQAG